MRELGWVWYTEIWFAFNLCSSGTRRASHFASTKQLESVELTGKHCQPLLPWKRSKPPQSQRTAARQPQKPHTPWTSIYTNTKDSFSVWSVCNMSGLIQYQCYLATVFINARRKHMPNQSHVLAYPAHISRTTSQHMLLHVHCCLSTHMVVLKIIFAVNHIHHIIWRYNRTTTSLQFTHIINVTFTMTITIVAVVLEIICKANLVHHLLLHHHDQHHHPHPHPHHDPHHNNNNSHRRRGRGCYHPSSSSSLSSWLAAGVASLPTETMHYVTSHSKHGIIDVQFQ